MTNGATRRSGLVGSLRQQPQPHLPGDRGRELEAPVLVGVGALAGVGRGVALRPEEDPQRDRRDDPPVEASMAVDGADADEHAVRRTGELEGDRGVVPRSDDVGATGARGVVDALDEGQHLVLGLEALDRQPGEDAVGQVVGCGIEVGVEHRDRVEQLLVGLLHVAPPSSTRSFSRQRRRVGPMLPIGISRLSATEE